MSSVWDGKQSHRIFSHCSRFYFCMRDKLLHHLFQWVLIVHNHLSKPGIFSITKQETSHNTWPQKFAALHKMLLLCVLPWTVCHFMGIVVEADYRFALLNSRKQHHQGSVRHHQIQVVLCEVKIYSLHCGKKTLCYTAAMSLNKKCWLPLIQLTMSKKTWQTSIVFRSSQTWSWRNRKAQTLRV